MDLASADVQDLMLIPGIGKKWAQSIVHAKKKNTAIEDLDQLAREASLPVNLLPVLQEWIVVNENNNQGQPKKEYLTR